MYIFVVVSIQSSIKRRLKKEEDLFDKYLDEATINSLSISS